jgi:hypothetical protein
MFIFSELYRCNASQRRYEGPWLFLREMMWSLTFPRTNRISGLYNFRSSPEKDFCNTICQYRKWRLMADRRRICSRKARGCPSISCLSKVKSIGLVKSPQAPFSIALRQESW